jgi:pyridoxine 4-dehydrogenase
MTSHTVTAGAAGSWQLGGLTVNRMGYGAMRLTTGADGGPSDRDQVIGVLRRAREIGVNHIDTASFYISPLRSANELINTALAPYPGDLVIATKVGPGKDTWCNWTDRARPDQLRGQVEENLRQLGRDQLDLVYLRVQDAGSLAERFGVLAGLRDAGLIRELGVSGVTPEQLAEARGVAPVVSVQNRYGVGATPAEHEFLRACGEQGIAFVPYFAVARGARSTGGAGAATGLEQAVAQAHGVSVAQVRLAWTLQRGQHVLAIPGTGSPAHLVENVAAGALALTDAEMASLTGGEMA